MRTSTVPAMIKISQARPLGQTRLFPAAVKTKRKLLVASNRKKKNSTRLMCSV
jgi:hypothetical protein